MVIAHGLDAAQWGTVGEWVAGLGTLAAVLVALRSAKHERDSLQLQARAFAEDRAAQARERRAEELADAARAANLVRFSATWSNYAWGSKEATLHMSAQVTNDWYEPYFDLELRLWSDLGPGEEVHHMAMLRESVDRLHLYPRGVESPDVREVLGIASTAEVPVTSSEGNPMTGPFFAELRFSDRHGNRWIARPNQPVVLD